MEKNGDKMWNSINEDALYSIFQFLNFNEFINVHAVCKSWKKLCSDDSLWKKMCEYVWKDKQNLDVEQWVKLENDSLISRTSDDIHKLFKNSTKPSFMSNKNSSNLKEELNSQQNQDSESSNNIFKEEIKDDVRLYNYEDYSLNDLKIEEEKLQKEIKQTYKEIQSINEFSIFLINNVNRENVEIYVSVFGSYEKKLEELKIVKDRMKSVIYYRNAKEYGTTKRNAAPISVFVKEATDNGFSREEIKEKMNLNLLSWKDSLKESLKDAKRTFPVSEELEGDWKITFGEKEHEIARFVEGGTKYIDNRAFLQREGTILNNCGRITWEELDETATIVRTKDWGWKLVSDNGFVVLNTFDKKSGYPTDTRPLRTPLRFKYPINEEERKGEGEVLEQWEDQDIEPNFND